jgi:hypothetical protein
MVIRISSNGGIKTIDRRWLLQKEPMRMDHDRGSQTTPFLRTSFSYDHIIICHLHCRHVPVRTTTAAAVLLSSTAAACTTHQPIVCVLPRCCCSCEEMVVVVFISSIPAQKNSSDDQCIPETSVGILDYPNIDWLSVQKDIVTVILWKTDLDIWASQLIYTTGGMN